ncbi:MAG: S1C family serine protease, partial [Gammaproteobacteria bacterium]|nr:S1C family serine protease [Gammaproteobacteria bacterium]
MKRILVVLTVLMLATLACQVTSLTAPTVPSPSPQINTVAPEVFVSEPSFEDGSLMSIYEKSLPGVVALRVTTAQGSGVGSGFVFDTNGNIVTNLHVIEGATEV